MYNEQSNKFTFSRLNYDFQIGGTAKEWLGFTSSTITDNVSSNGLLVSTTEILDSILINFNGYLDLEDNLECLNLDLIIVVALDTIL